MQIGHDGSEWQVRACATLPGEGGEIGPDSDVTAVFIAALGKAFTPGILEAVVSELALGPRPGEPLASGVVLQAIAMAEASQQAMLGVDFMTQFMCSAVAQSSGFIQACEALGLSERAVSAQHRVSIDASMSQRFAQAARQMQSPVDDALAQEWLRSELAVVMGPLPGPR